MKTEFGKVAVLMGGNSVERDISLKSGQAILKALLEQDINAVAIDTADNHFVTQLIESNFNHAFIALHGRGGEDGSLQGLLEHLGLPYTGSGVLASSLAMDKYRTKQLWQGMGLPTPASFLLETKSHFNEVIAQLGWPLMIKPSLEGSSVGITKVTTLSELAQAWEVASQFNCEVIAERYISGLEYTAAILQDTVLPLIRLETPRTFYDFKAKYSDTETTYLCPCGLPPEQEKKLQELAMQAFKAVGAQGWGRVDFLCDHTGQPWLLEVNTIPGMTTRSLVPMAAKANGFSFNELVWRILATA